MLLNSLHQTSYHKKKLKLLLLFIRFFFPLYLYLSLYSFFSYCASKIHDDWFDNLVKPYKIYDFHKQYHFFMFCMAYCSHGVRISSLLASNFHLPQDLESITEYQYHLPEDIIRILMYQLCLFYYSSLSFSFYSSFFISIWSRGLTQAPSSDYSSVLLTYMCITFYSLSSSDIKPANAMLACTDDKYIHLKIADFGLAREAKNNMASTHCGFLYTFYID